MAKDQKRRYVTLDDASDLRLAKEDPIQFFAKYPPPVLIDEIQRAPNLFLEIKKIVDAREECNQFWLTGSHIFHLMQNVADSLAGRMAVLNLQGFSQAEKMNDHERPAFLPNISLRQERPILSKKEIFKMIVKGSFPRLFNSKVKWPLYFSSYVSTYIERDVQEISNIGHKSAFDNFLKIMAARTGQILNFNEIANALEVSAPTVKSWVSILETSGLIYLLHPYARNLGQRMIKRPKMYFIDTGLCCYLNGITTAEMAIASTINGALFETYVVSEILKSYWHNGERPDLYFFRDAKNNREIDLLLEAQNKIWPIEIKLTSSPNLHMAKNFEIIDPAKRGKGAIICTAEKFMPMNKNIMMIPASYIWPTSLLIQAAKTHQCKYTPTIYLIAGVYLHMINVTR